MYIWKGYLSGLLKPDYGCFLCVISCNSETIPLSGSTYSLSPGPLVTGSRYGSLNDGVAVALNGLFLQDNAQSKSSTE